MKRENDKEVLFDYCDKCGLPLAKYQPRFNYPKDSAYYLCSNCALKMYHKIFNEQEQSHGE